MKEQKIVVEIDRNGRITADAEGFTGDACLKDLEKLLEGLGSLSESTTRKGDDTQAKVRTAQVQTLGEEIMSAFITLMTPMTDQECLVEALAVMGFGEQRLERHAEPVSLVGYEGMKRPQVANLIIRRQFVGPGSNDVGFLKTATGFQAIISGFDQGRFGGAWLAKLHEAYQSRVSEKEARLAELDRQAREREAQQRELERQKLVEAQRQAIEQKARSLGYMVKESREADKIRLVLVKRTY